MEIPNHNNQITNKFQNPKSNINLPFPQPLPNKGGEHPASSIQYPASRIQQAKVQILIALPLPLHAEKYSWG